MRINLDEPVPDDSNGAVELAAEDEDTSDEAEADASTDELVIRRDLETRRRRRAAPRVLTPAQQRAIAAFLVVVIVVAVASLGLYLKRVQEHARRLPALTAQTSPTPVQVPAGPSMRPPRPLTPPAYQGPPPRNITPLEEPAGSDTDTPGEGIH